MSDQITNEEILAHIHDDYINLVNEQGIPLYMYQSYYSSVSLVLSIGVEKEEVNTHRLKIDTDITKN